MSSSLRLTGKHLGIVRKKMNRHVEFARTKEQLFDRWCTSKKIGSTHEKLRQLKIVEEFKRCINSDIKKKGRRKVQGVPQSQTAALPRPQEEEETDKSKQAQIEQTYEKH